DLYNKIGFSGQSQAIILRYSPSIRVLHAGCAIHYKLVLVNVSLDGCISSLHAIRRQIENRLAEAGVVHDV
uniref:WS_DGAT_C domain-containing protein n=1 Tax=Mesocestoides corti TaxID=53468 RepID=A0A5K3ENB1_MESCO